MQPFGAALRRLNRQRLQTVRLEVVARCLGLFGALANAFSRRDHENRRMIALAVSPRQYVIAQAQPVSSWLPLEMEGMQRFPSARTLVDRTSISCTRTVVEIVGAAPSPESACSRRTVSRFAGSIDSFVSSSPVIASFA